MEARVTIIDKNTIAEIVDIITKKCDTGKNLPAFRMTRNQRVEASADRTLDSARTADGTERKNNYWNAVPSTKDGCGGCEYDTCIVETTVETTLSCINDEVLTW
ncbi:Hypothetical protein CINCED_3A014528 [Cinara cedri]|uniref:Uncharacterized protein n=1 Tax=Cinara cedri TaxID=506608 RepID=A0A5E4MYN0_9HEMI|nr:Hypothetical protein CINCED_3A014528 [Cinara cedri]